jgi:VanZ family protein
VRGQEVSEAASNNKTEVFPRTILLVLAYSLIFGIAVVSVVPGEYRPHTNVLPNELEHVAAYILAGFFISMAYRGRLSLTRVVVLLTGYGALLEFLQLWIPGRNGEVIGVAADFAGALTGALIAKALERQIYRGRIKIPTFR